MEEIKKADEIKILGRRALIGRGFVGQNLDKPGRFTDHYHSKNIQDMSGHYDLIVIAAPNASKYLANAYPREDYKAIDEICKVLQQVSAEKVVLISTIDATRLHPYGKHRLELEGFVLGRFPNALILRLPAVFGPGLKKNVLFDLLDREKRKHSWCGTCAFGLMNHPDNRYQWFNIEKLWYYIQSYVNGTLLPGTHRLYSESISVGELIERFFDDYAIYFEPEPSVQYNEPSDIPHYLKNEVVEEMDKFIKQWRAEHVD
jgi:hypothetical protein